ncbi:50S ribosomal protein L18 [candidate division WWE3 bacterium CG_4_9_14_0_2_um_filter_35_11]|uniref:Large ribosomal subunit protein uL18 n=1 Tax=candidate division WWE3 bacterium CG_4_9_14_0_2_um_filter_35_11 TaxID=1975077 RepID=A0A2M8EKY8_UNCKA|nr:MAG: 50S ribosomal protein L18 [candidate division WWE3 bacterium CG10_big_fil_rev_8_21_14_0_10_35_32]PJC23360.1 MAG: 50S ribosomal protein L18 [candidate division WWE3 bacterium CG_4_9_14_0_2_um_filter_35_11]
MIIKTAKERRKFKVRGRITGTAEVPRICVFRSNRFIYAQAIDDVFANTIASCASKSLKEVPEAKTKMDFALETGKALGESLKKLNVKKAIFDRGYYKYHGRVSKLAEGLRSSGVIF